MLGALSPDLSLSPESRRIRGHVAKAVRPVGFRGYTTSVLEDTSSSSRKRLKRRFQSPSVYSGSDTQATKSPGKVTIRTAVSHGLPEIRHGGGGLVRSNSIIVSPKPLNYTLSGYGIAQERPGWSLYASEDEKRVLYDLIDYGRHDVAQRLNDLIEMFVMDPDVGRLNLASLNSVAKFFKQNKELRPNIAAGWDGYLSVDWRLPPVDPHGEERECAGILGLEFLPDGQIEYLGFIRVRGIEERIEYEGVTGHDNIIGEVSSFLQKM